MKPVFQTRHGMKGNCFAASIATLLDVPLDRVPNLTPPEDGTVFNQNVLVQDFLATLGLFYLEVEWDHPPRFSMDCAAFGYVVLTVDSADPEVAKKGYTHAVVGKLRQLSNPDRVDAGVIHDPRGPVRNDYKITAIGWIAARNPERFAPE